MTDQKKFEEMELPELVSYGRTELGLDVNLRMKPEKVRGLIADALGADHVGLAPAAEAMGSRASRFSNAVAISNVHIDNGVDWDDLVVINIAESKEDRHAVPVSVNGYTLLMKRGVNLAVPRAYARILETALEDDISQDNETGEMHVRRVSAYPFTYVQMH